MNQEDRDRLVRIEEKVDQIREQGKDHESRLRGLERWKWWATGGLAMLSLIFNKVWK